MVRTIAKYAAWIAPLAFVGGVVTYFLTAVYEFVFGRSVDRIRVTQHGVWVTGWIALWIMVFVRP